MVEARLRVGFFSGRPISRTEVAVGSIHPATGRDRGTDPGGAAVVGNSGRYHFDAGKFSASKYNLNSTWLADTTDIIRYGQQRTARFVSELTGEFAC
jgi:hypothetical protein